MLRYGGEGALEIGLDMDTGYRVGSIGQIQILAASRDRFVSGPPHITPCVSVGKPSVYAVPARI